MSSEREVWTVVEELLVASAIITSFLSPDFCLKVASKVVVILLTSLLPILVS